MTPKFGCGYFFVNPEYISKKLKKELTKIARLKWSLPYYLKSNSKLYQPYDIIVKDNNKIIGPLFQTNSQEI